MALQSLQLIWTIQCLCLTCGTPQKPPSFRYGICLEQPHLFLWYVPKLLHDMDQGKAELGTWTLKLESALKSVSLEVSCRTSDAQRELFVPLSCLTEHSRSLHLHPSVQGVWKLPALRSPAMPMNGCSSTSGICSTDLEFSFQGTNRS